MCEVRLCKYFDGLADGTDSKLCIPLSLESDSLLQVSYKAEWYGSIVMLAPRFFPSSK